ncbi:hypothetical protein ACFJZD_02645 [Enterococcus faecalis]|uniref:hypothetical protein n=1 Tax=Enterococcus faecalis TaxID=1351 RepID=UPI0003538B76|nr:hypothetical protein [Enterococcus faecalis]EGO2726192.1 hypothetical protein [Enterococcus faecalis]EGO8565526.1 hypothetical protein [Enterococcus faecalis]EGO8712127.1 hypothetical protein [Enterococcus faecalis]EIQ7138313.1 hypothetical protein [Enterococcus faecalis]EIQ7161988.1 hypothetical protein [Enterococcus faecalis]
MLDKKFNMYDYIGHVVQIIKKNGTVVTAFVTDCETDFDNDVGDAMLLDMETTHLPQKYRQAIPLVTVFIRDIKDIEIIE